jgi:hypothetical protein
MKEPGWFMGDRKCLRLAEKAICTRRRRCCLTIITGASFGILEYWITRILGMAKIPIS